MRWDSTRVLCPECRGEGEYEMTTSDPEAIDPPTVLCRRCFGRGYVFVPVQQSLEFPADDNDYDPFALEEETENERDACEV